MCGCFSRAARDRSIADLSRANSTNLETGAETMKIVGIPALSEEMTSSRRTRTRGRTRSSSGGSDSGGSRTRGRTRTRGGRS
jgi:hypothetical protein